MRAEFAPPAIAELIRMVSGGHVAGPEDFKVRAIAGSGILLTAPHAVPHLHSQDPSKVKGADLLTGEIASLAAARHGWSAAIALSPWFGNGNYDPLERCAFKQHVLARLVSGEASATIDLHGMTDAHGFDICVGSGGAVATAEAVADALSGFSVSVDIPFSASGQGTVTRTVLAAGFPAVQLEMSSAVRKLRSEEILQALPAVAEALKI